MLKTAKFSSNKQKKITPVARQESTSLCALCRGTKFLCGKTRCPVVVKYHSRNKVKHMFDRTHLGAAYSVNGVFGQGGISVPVRQSNAGGQHKGNRNCE